MKRTLLLIFCFATFANVSAQAPEITGDVMLCPYTDGTATVTNPIYDSYQWYSKYWFTSDPYVAIAGATGPSFTYDWFTYDQSLFKVVTTLNGTTYESNEIQIDSYAWASFSVGTELNEFVSTNPNNGNLLLCSGASFTASIFMPYDSGIQWYKNGVPISGANEMNYVITGPGLYHVEAAPSFCPDSVSSNETLPIVVEEDTSCSLGTNDPDISSAFTMYPNPANDFILLDFNTGSSFTSYRIIDASGKVLEQRHHIENEQQININTAHLAAGFYLLQLLGDSTMEVKQFIKR